ncbi:hypothetical protein ACJJIE_00010 (plasmid) [Microbulbifer sp. TRSA001]|uniref:hypothetical protein n=1 Tax=Microbulbifer sp. TRSA001 TaxID=3243381 RepID=UPI00403A7676
MEFLFACGGMGASVGLTGRLRVACLSSLSKSQLHKPLPQRQETGGFTGGIGVEVSTCGSARSAGRLNGQNIRYKPG